MPLGAAVLSDGTAGAVMLLGAAVLSDGAAVGRAVGTAVGTAVGRAVGTAVFGVVPDGGSSGWSIVALGLRNSPSLGWPASRGGVSGVCPGLVHGPRPSSDLPLQRLRILAAVHVVGDADDHAAAGEKNAWAPLIQHQHVVVEHGSKHLLKTVTRNSTVIQTSHR